MNIHIPDYTLASFYYSLAGFALGVVTGGVVRFADAPRKWITRVLNKRHLIGLVVLILAVLTTGQGLYFSYHYNHQGNCQYKINQEFLNTLKARSQLNIKQQQNINNLVNSVYAAGANGNRIDPQKVIISINQYLTNLRTINGELAKETYPTFTSCN